MKVLFIGGTGVISSACSVLALETGIDLYLLTRGNSTRQLPNGVKQIIGDIRNPSSIKQQLQDFDVVVNWVAFEPDHIETDLELFKHVKQYVFISSASVYQTPPQKLPVTERTPIENPFWDYSQAKIACEERLMAAKANGFPITIIRPSHTYDQTMLPVSGRWTIVDRMLQGKPVIVHGDGTSIWTLTHHRDFAKGFVPLLGNEWAINESFHITSDEWLTWNQIFNQIGQAVNIEPNLIHVPSEYINRHDPDWGAGLLGDKAHSMIFDNTKVKSIVPEFKCTIPFHEGIKEIIFWHRADKRRQIIDQDLSSRMDNILSSLV
ncbi:MAG: NAD-dependent epimerase/dehydratase family protein [Cyclobacteriaceae bacterium]